MSYNKSTSRDSLGEVLGTVNDYFESATVSANKMYTYTVLLDKNSSRKIYKEGESEPSYVLYYDGIQYLSKKLKNNFAYKELMTRDSLLDYLEGTEGIVEVYGYKETDKHKTREDILEEIQDYIYSQL